MSTCHISLKYSMLEQAMNHDDLRDLRMHPVFVVHERCSDHLFPDSSFPPSGHGSSITPVELATSQLSFFPILMYELAHTSWV